MKKVKSGVEVLPKGANLTCHVKFDVLPKIEAQLKLEIDQFHLLEKEASWRALRIGMLLLKVKSSLDHGKFIPWLAHNIPEFSQRHCYRFMQLAEQFLRAKKLTADESAFLLCEASQEKPSQSDLGPKIVQLAFEFLGDSSLNDLFKKYHIMTSLPKGGHHPADPNKQRLPEDPEKEAITDWTEICEKLSYHGIQKKTWANLPNMELCKVFDLIDLVHSQMRDAVKKIKQVKK